jgi:AcrR family transcriptional regulator
MPRSPRKPTTRKRRTVEEARSEILDAAEAVLRRDGPSAIRLQDVAATVGMSHPTVLHHFGSREGLLDAVVAQSMESVHLGLQEGLKAAPGEHNVRKLLDFVSGQLQETGRTLLQLSLAGHGSGVDGLKLGQLVDMIHALRKQMRAERGAKAPTREDTYFTVLLAALSLLSLSVLETQSRTIDGKRFRAWLAKVMHHHLERGFDEES